MSEDTTYNGWTNYPTWAVNMWLSNDEGLYNATLERVQDVTAGYDRDQYSTERVPYRLADDLKAWVTDELAPDLGASFAADLLGYALDCVDWDEIANAWLETAGEVTA